MSQENVEIVRRAFEAQRQHDNDTIFALYDPEVEWEPDPSADGPSLRVVRGVEALQDMWRDFFGVFESADVEVEEWIDAGDEVIAILRGWGRGRQSGVPFERREAHVWTVRGGKMRRLRIYPTRAEALEAAGLRE